MKKVLIISYFYPPCNLTAGQRIEGWAKNLHLSGIYPIIITRNWDNEIRIPKDLLKASGSEIRIEKNEHYEVHYLPYQQSLRDKIQTNLDSRFSKFTSKILTLNEIIFDNYSNYFIPYANIYDYCLEMIKSSVKVKGIIVSGGPFAQFRFGYKLNKNTGLPWIADYRDDWTTSEVEVPNGLVEKAIRKIQQKTERKWVNTASAVTTVSRHYATKIQKLVGTESVVIQNGYTKLLNTEVSEGSSKTCLKITYNGSLYPTQNIEHFLNVIRRLILEDGKEINLYFPGLGFDAIQKKRVESLTKEYSDKVFITDRIIKEEVIKIQNESDILLMLSHEGLKGIPSSKLYEYISLVKPILLVYNDNDIIEDTLLKTGLGIITESETHLYKSLSFFIENKQENNAPQITANFEGIKSFSKTDQVELLAKLINMKFD